MGSWAVNTWAIFCGGRLDGGAKGVQAAKDSKSAALPVVRYFMPAGWAFAIWGPIILGERQHTTNGHALVSIHSRKQSWKIAIVYNFPAGIHARMMVLLYVSRSYTYLARRYLLYARPRRSKFLAVLGV